MALLRLKQLLDLPPDCGPAAGRRARATRTLPPPPSFAERVVVVENALRSNEAADAEHYERPVAACAYGRRRRAPRSDARGVAEADRGAEDAERVAELELCRIAYPENVALPTFDRTNWTVGVSMSVPILTGGRQRGDELVARAELEQIAPAAAAGRGARGARHAVGVGRAACGARGVGSHGRDGPAGDARLRDRRRALSAPASRRSSSCRMRGCCCSRPRPTGRWPRATCRWRARVWRCCRTCRSGTPFRVPRRSSPQRDDAGPQFQAAARQQQPQAGQFRNASAQCSAATGRDSDE